MGDIQLIVDALNKPPFSMDLSLVLFDEKSPFELLKTLNDVMAHLDKRYNVDIRDESSEQTGARMTEFSRSSSFPCQQCPSRCNSSTLVYSKATEHYIPAAAIPAF